VIISDYNKGFVSEKDIEAISKAHPLTFLDTKKILGPWCEGVTFIKINNYEYERTKHMLSDEIEDRLIVTMGPDGAKFNGITYPVEDVEIKDSSGAGDTFISALAVQYVKSGDIGKAIEFANECATIVVQKRGVSTVREAL
jgi:sugar/nucleoside kinase (ribokinase family)